MNILDAAPALARVAAGADLPCGIPGLDTRFGLQRSQGRDAYLARLRAFAAGQEPVPAQIRAALAEGDPGTAERLAQGLQGTLGEIGAHSLRHWAVHLQAALLARRAPETLDALADGLEVRMAELIGQLNHQLGT